MAIDFVYFILRCKNALNLDLLYDYQPKSGLGLSQTEAKTLYAVLSNEGNLLSYYSRQLKLKSGSFSSVVSSLEKKKLIIVERDERDKRVKLLSLTDSGRLHAEAVGDGLSEYLNEKLGAMSDAEKKTFADCLTGLERLSIKYDL